MRRFNPLSLGTAKLSLAACIGTSALITACGGSDNSFTAPFLDATLTLPAAAAPVATQSPAGTSEYQRHLDAATANAGKEFAGEQRRQWCYSVENAGAPPELQDTTVVPMTKMFDNLYYTGRRWVGQYILKTPNGYFLLDAQNSTDDAKTLTIPGLVSAGINPASLKGIMPTHGHGDHYNGAKFMQDTYGGPVYIGSEDAAALTAANARNAAVFSGSIVTTSLSTGTMTPQTLAVDGLNLTVLSTPGHTPGTFSGILPAQLGSKTYKLIFWGGTGTPTTLPLAKAYLDGSERLYQLAVTENVDGTIHTHPFADGSLAKLDAINKGTTGVKNPFLVGNASTLRSLSILRECSAAKVNALDATVINPVWLTTTTEVAASKRTGSNGTSNVAGLIRVSDPYGPVANALVKLSLSVGSDSCTATTDAAGVASCAFLTTQPTQGGIATAQFAGTRTSTQVQLQSSASVALNQ
jgi:glyoxylase-like metal-dependent hydrolase (beta-lactamase superfamily II)